MPATAAPTSRRTAVLALVLLAVLQTAAVAGLYVVFVRTRTGQLVDSAALYGNSIGQSHIREVVSTVLGVVSVASLAVTTLVIALIALSRRRVWVAVAAVGLIGAANVTTQVLKDLLVRPDLTPGFGLGGSAANSLPSGHTTVAMSAAVALVLVVPPRLRGATALAGGAYAALTGVATLSAGWHRPSDAMAACLVVGFWACVAGLGLVAVAGRPGRPGVPHVLSGSLLWIVTVALLVVGLVGMGVSAATIDGPLEVLQLGRRRLLVAYAGGAAAIAGTALAVMATVLLTVHRVVGGGPADEDPPASGIGRD